MSELLSEKLEFILLFPFFKETLECLRQRARVIVSWKQTTTKSQG